MTFGEKLKKTRKEAGLSQEQLAEKMSVSRSAVAKWESGSRQFLVKVSTDFLSTSELANKVDPGKFGFGKYIFRKAPYQLI